MSQRQEDEQQSPRPGSPVRQDGEPVAPPVGSPLYKDGPRPTRQQPQEDSGSGGGEPPRRNPGMR